MKKKDFEDFKISLDVRIEIDSNIRRIGEKIALLNKLGKISELSKVSTLLSDTNYIIDDLINKVFEGDEQ